MYPKLLLTFLLFFKKKYEIGRINNFISVISKKKNNFISDSHLSLLHVSLSSHVNGQKKMKIFVVKSESCFLFFLIFLGKIRLIYDLLTQLNNKIKEGKYEYEMNTNPFVTNSEHISLQKFMILIVSI